MVFVPKQKAPASAASSAGAVTATARGVAEAADAAMKDKLRGDHLPEREELAQLLQQRQAQRGVAGSGCGYRHCQKPAAGVSCSSCSYGPVYCSAACVVRGALRWAGLAGSLPLGSGCLAEHLPPGCRRRRMLRPSLASGAAGRPCAGPACNPLQSSANSARGAAQRGLPRLSCAPPPPPLCPQEADQVAGHMRCHVHQLGLRMQARMQAHLAARQGQSRQVQRWDDWTVQVGPGPGPGPGAGPAAGLVAVRWPGGRPAPGGRAGVRARPSPGLL
jgi:hypothetical protein